MLGYYMYYSDGIQIEKIERELRRTFSNSLKGYEYGKSKIHND